MSPNAAALKMLLSFLASLALLAILLFWGAGRLDWTLGWVFGGVWIAPKLSFLIVLRWRDPDLLVERATRHRGTPRYDRVLQFVYFVLAFGSFLVASLDAWNNSPPPNNSPDCVKSRAGGDLCLRACAD